MTSENPYNPLTSPLDVRKNGAIAMALSDIHLLRMLARVKGANEVMIIMKGYGYTLDLSEAEGLAKALDGTLTITVRGLVALFNSLEVPKSIPPEVPAHFIRGREWLAPTEP